MDSNPSPKKKTKRTKEFYRKIGAKGGRNSTFRGFRDVEGLASKAGSISGYKLKKRNKN